MDGVYLHPRAAAATPTLLHLLLRPCARSPAAPARAILAQPVHDGFQTQTRPHTLHRTLPPRWTLGCLFDSLQQQ
ncbi:hypothetical protein HDU96_006780 [Phlyctochytrium bullatum]|nr:hypothetical protein HDU96_006780 [Phlyctochytrium bullatum]